MNNSPCYGVPVEYRDDIEIEVDDDVYPPSEDSELLVQSLDVRPGERILEIGSGSGIVAIHCAVNGCLVTAVDVNPKAVTCTKNNAKRNGMMIDARLSDLYGNVEGCFDTIVFNLPYLPVSEDGDLAKAWSGGPDGLGPLPELLSGAPSHLNANGRVVIVTSSLMDKDALERALTGWKIKEKGTLALFFERLSVIELRK
jgi:release factor glutamine methyltransferase